MKASLGLILVGGLLSMSMVIPSKTETPFFRVYSNVKFDREANTAFVSVSRLSGRGQTQQGWDFNTGSSVLEIPLALFEDAREIADTVLTARPADTATSFGTAFHIGEGYILTNQHVLSPSRDNIDRCGSFSVKTGNGKDNFQCKEVIHCDEKIDFCVIKLKAVLKWGFWGSPLRAPETLPVLKFNPSTPPSDALYATVGNPMGAGLHFSRGRGLGHKAGSFLFYAPVHSGNSGGPLVNEANEIVGLVYAQSKYGIDESGHNWAIPIKTIVTKLKEALGNEHTAVKLLDR